MTAYDLAQRFVGEVKETPGDQDHPFIVWCLSLTGISGHDEVPWCSAFLNGIHWMLRLPRSKSAAARSWLALGGAVSDPQAGDVVILSRGEGVQPGPEVLSAPGHVGFYAGSSRDGRVAVLAGNQGNAVTVAEFHASRVLGYRRVG